MVKKDNEKSLLLRKQGNDLYKEKKFFDSLLKYNESLCYAEPGSEHLGYAFSNRSAVYFEMKLYQKALENVKLAIENNYPKGNLEILSSREEKCRKNLKLPQEHKNNFFKLKSKGNEKIPFISDSLEMKEDGKYGRYIVTNRRLVVGEVIAIEKPFACAPILKSNNMESNKFQRCNSCLRDNLFDLIPCENCCDAMFCTKECYKSATEKFHKYECKVMDQITLHANLNIVLRIFFIGFSIFNENIEKFYKFYEDTLKNPKTIFDFDFSKEESEKDKLAALLSLSKSKKSFSLLNYIEILNKLECIKVIWDKNHEMIESILQTICKISDHNFYGYFIASMKPTTGYTQDDLQEAIGTSANIFCSLTNHSCAPNIARVSFDGKTVVVVCKVVPEGDQIFDCYKVNFLSFPKAERQIRLKEEFDFECDCVACTNDWPMAKAPEMPMKFGKYLNVIKKSFRNEPSKVVKEFAPILNKEAEHYPSRELCAIQKIILQNILKLTVPKFYCS